MELPSCPACGQSVLDDDVEDCPFCGASMKTGKPGKKPAVVAAAAKAASPKPAAAQKPKAAEVKQAAAEAPKSRPARNPFDEDDDVPAAAADDDPFALEKTAAKDVIPLRASPAKGYAVKFVCPMCETAGYSSSKAAGKQVKCANPKCLVPVFEAPAPKVEKAPEPPPPPPKPKFTPGVLFGGFALLLVIGAGVAWSMGLIPGLGGGGSKKISDDARELAKEFGSEDPPAETVKPPANDKKPTPAVTPDPKEGDSLDALRKRALDDMVALARKEQPERGKAVCRRFTAISYALADDMTEARNQIDQLAKVAPNIPYYRIVPLTAVGWENLRLGRADDAKKAADDAWQLRDKLPDFGREPLVITLDFAALLAALGRLDDAERLVRSQKEQAEEALVTTPLLQARADRSFDVTAAVAKEPALPWKAPHWVAVTKILAGRKQWDASLAWSKRHPDVEPRTECLAAWAEAAATHSALTNDSKALEPLAAVSAELEKSPAGRARLWAAVAIRQAAAGKKEVAEASLKAARESIAAVPETTPFALPGTKGIIEAEIPNSVPFRMAAQASTDIARAESMLGHSDDADASLQTALAHTRGIGPSLPPIHQLVVAADQMTKFVRDQLKAELELTTQDETDRNFNAYRRQCERLQAAAEHRRDVQARLLASVLNTPLRDNVWQILSKTSGPEGGPTGDPLFDTPLPWDAAEAFDAASDATKAAAVRGVISQNSKRKPTAQQSAGAAATAAVAAGKYDEAATVIDKSETDRNWKGRWVLMACCDLIRAGKLDGAIALVKGFRKDAILREESYENLASFASRIGQSKKVWEAAQAKGYTPAEQVALMHGFISGSLAAGKDGEPAATAQAR